MNAYHTTQTVSQYQHDVAVYMLTDAQQAHKRNNIIQAVKRTVMLIVLVASAYGFVTLLSIAANLYR